MRAPLKILKRHQNQRGLAGLPYQHLTGSIYGDEVSNRLDFETNWRGVTAYRFNDSDYGMESTLEGEGNQSKSTELLVVNAGPSNDGYRICSSCGYVHLGSSEDKASHHRLRAIDRQKVNIYARQLVNIQLEKLIEECDEETDADKKKTLQQKVEKFQENFENNGLPNLTNYGRKHKPRAPVK